MAALYLHNALFTPEPAHTLPHLRTLSASTVTTASAHGGTGPRPISSDDLIPSPTRRERYPALVLGEDDEESGNGTWRTEPLVLVGDPPTAEEIAQNRSRATQRKRRRWKLARLITGVVVFGWAVYTTVRYFLAYAAYTDDFLRRNLALAFGCASALAALLNAVLPFQRFISMHTLTTPHVHAFFSTAPVVASFGLIAPATANLVLTALWHGGCGWDIDALWPPPPVCQADDATWGAWLAGSISRFVLTFCILALFHTTLLLTTRTTNARPIYRRDQTTTPLRAPHSPQSPHSPRSPAPTPLSAAAHPHVQRLRMSERPSSQRPVSFPARTRHPDPETSSLSSSSSSSSSPTSPFSFSSSEQQASSSRHDSSSSSRGAERGTALPRNAVPLLPAKSSRRRTRSPGQSPPSSYHHPTPRYSYVYPTQQNPAPQDATGRPASYTAPTGAAGPSSTDTRPRSMPTNPSADARLQLWAADFRSAMERIDRETEEGLALALTDQTASYAYDDGNSTRSHASTSSTPMSTAPRPHHRRPETVRILGSYVRRMSTIESFGSREVASGTSGDERATMVGSRGGSIRSGVAGSLRSGVRTSGSGAWGPPSQPQPPPPGSASGSVSSNGPSSRSNTGESWFDALES